VVITNVSATAIVVAGMSTMATLLFVVSLVGALSLFRLPLVSAWASSVRGEITIDDYFLLAAFVTSLSLVIGALGASFEDQHHFRHIIFVDEEA
jgi:hypothetical protein